MKVHYTDRAHATFFLRCFNMPSILVYYDEMLPSVAARCQRQQRTAPTLPPRPRMLYTAERERRQQAAASMLYAMPATRHPDHPARHMLLFYYSHQPTITVLRAAADEDGAFRAAAAYAAFR